MGKMKGALLVLVSAFCFGFMPVFGKIAYENGSNNFTVLGLRFIFASMLLYIYLKIKKIPLKITKKQLIHITSISICGYFVCSIMYFTSFQYISVGLSTMLLYTHPAIVVIFSLIIYKEKLTIQKVLSIILTTIGIYFLVNVNSTSFNFKGILLAVISSIGYSIYILGLNKNELKRVNSFVITFYVCFVTAIIIIITGIYSNEIIWTQNIATLTSTFLLALISTLVAMLTFVEGVKIIGPSKAAILSTLEPVVSLILAFIFFKEIVTLKIIVGSMLIISSIVVLAIKN